MLSMLVQMDETVTENTFLSWKQDNRFEIFILLNYIHITN